jgi:hypothetical protein
MIDSLKAIVTLSAILLADAEALFVATIVLHAFDPK